VPLIGNRAAGAYRVLTYAAPAIAGPARPGQFVSAAVGGPTSAHLLRRSFSIHRAVEGIVELVVSPVGPGSEWLCGLQPGDEVDLVGPLGRPFPLPRDAVSCVLVGGGYGSAPLFWLAEALRARVCHVEMVLGAATEASLFRVDDARRVANGTTVTTDDGSAGSRGWVSDVLGTVISLSRASVVYACGPMGMLQSVATIAARHDAIAQVAVEEAMACGVGVCMTCVLPVVGDDGQTRMTRSCVEGPVFRGDRIRWEAFADGRCLVPADAVGAPR